MAPIRILHFVGNMHNGGMETFIMNMYRKIDKSQVQFDFVSHRRRKAEYEDEIAELGGKVYHFPFRDDKNYFKYRKNLINLFKEHPEYRIVHGHHSAMGFLYLGIAKKCGIPVRIAHSHNAQYTHNVKGFFSHLSERKFSKYATDLFACSNKAGDFMFEGKKYTVIPNGIDANKFRFSQETRDSVRHSLGIENRFVVGHVGRFHEQKNHIFLLDIFKAIVDKDNSALLMLIGSGPLEDTIKNKAKELGISEHVMFMGKRQDVPQLMQGLDVFVFPSLYEGLPLTLVEAQTAGIPIVCSTEVTEECRMSPMYCSVSLNESAEKWADIVLSNKKSSVARDEGYEYILKAGYDSELCAGNLQKMYQEMIQRT